MWNESDVKGSQFHFPADTDMNKYQLAKPMSIDANYNDITDGNQTKDIQLNVIELALKRYE